MIPCRVPRGGPAVPDTPRRPLSETLKRPVTCAFNVNDRLGTLLVVLTLL